MLKRYLLFVSITISLIFVFIVSNAFAELKEEWHIHYTSEADIEDYEVDQNGNIYLVGWDREPGSCTDWFILSYDASGEFRWMKTYDGPDDPAVDSLSDSHTDDALEVEIGPNGMIYVAGRSSIYIAGSEYPDDLYGYPMIIGYSSLGSRVFEAFPEGDPDGNLAMNYNQHTDMLVDNNGFAHFNFGGVAISTQAGEATFLYDTDEISNGAFKKWHSLLGVDGVGNNYYAGYDNTDEGRFAGLVKLSPFGGVVWKTMTDLGIRSWCMAVDHIGHAYVTTSTTLTYTGGLIHKFGLGGGIEYSIPVPLDQAIYQMKCDNAGHLIINVQGHLYVYLSDNGALLWDVPNAYFFQLGPEGDIYVSGINGETARRFKPDGTMLWRASDITLYNGDNIYQSQFRVAENGCIYQAGFGGSEIWIEKLSQPKVFTIKDINNDTIPYAKFTMMKVTNDKPDYTEDTLGTFETDSLGNFLCDYLGVDSFLFVTDEYDIEPDTIVIGDTLKFSRLVTDLAAVKHSSGLGTMYSLHLDNIKFDELGALEFDTLDGVRQEIFMDHTEIRYNLLVSVEWDASWWYLAGLQENFRSMSNYLYDVTDGQMRVDTVMIYDNADHWLEADIWRYASNMEHARANANGIYRVNDGKVFMPRIWYYDVRNRSYYDHPIDIDEPIDYRTQAHEFGHYALDFYDEYLYLDPTDPDSGSFVNDPSLRCPQVAMYGFMQSQFPGADPYRSEMSSILHYQETACKNTVQFRLNNSSCWDHLESMFERLYEADTFYVPIIMATDSARASYPGSPYCPGPNNDLISADALDYDVGAKIVFPISPSSPAVGIMDVDAEIRQGGKLVPNAEVDLYKPNIDMTWRTIKQGKTADNARIIVLGAKAGDEIRSGGTRIVLTKSTQATQEEWLYGSAVVDSDSLTVDLAAVDGYFPMICEVVLSDTSGTYRLVNQTDFPLEPSLIYRPSGGGEYAYGPTSITDGYEVFIEERSGIYGTITVEAEDNSANNFFFINDYTFAEFTPGAAKIELFGPSGGSQILFNDSNETMEQAMFLSSPYTIIRTGLTEANIQASKTHCLSVYPNDAMTGNGLFRVLYSEADIIQRGGSADDETSLKIFRWADATTGWQEVGGSVDTVFNQVVETVSEPGVYAAFTTDASVDVDDECGDNLPYRFELSQNYPNPFNPVTTISYSLPRKSAVSIEIFNILGQKVKTLIDETKPAGDYQITWDGNDSNGAKVSTGIYFYRFQAGDFVETKKMILLK
ncbi:MAG: T9SS type A sorting domain-containing protein [Candidatus Zixiibacteriota bacterium]